MSIPPPLFLFHSLGYFTLLSINHFLGKPALFLHSPVRKGHHLENRKLQIMNKELTGRLKTRKEWIKKALETAPNKKLISKFLTCSNHSTAIPLSRNTIAPTINTWMAMGGGVEKAKFPAVIQPYVQRLLSRCISGPDGYPKGTWIICSARCLPLFVLLVLKPVQSI